MIEKVEVVDSFTLSFGRTSEVRSLVVSPLPAASF